MAVEPENIFFTKKKTFQHIFMLYVVHKRGNSNVYKNYRKFIDVENIKQKKKVISKNRMTEG